MYWAEDNINEPEFQTTRRTDNTGLSQILTRVSPQFVVHCSALLCIRRYTRTFRWDTLPEMFNFDPEEWGIISLRNVCIHIPATWRHSLQDHTLKCLIYLQQYCNIYYSFVNECMPLHKNINLSYSQTQQFLISWKSLLYALRMHRNFKVQLFNHLKPGGYVRYCRV
jgi:hypothetical protein